MSTKNDDTSSLSQGKYPWGYIQLIKFQKQQVRIKGQGVISLLFCFMNEGLKKIPFLSHD